jgi:hypothetical protein
VIERASSRQRHPGAPCSARAPRSGQERCADGQRSGSNIPSSLNRRSSQSPRDGEWTFSSDRLSNRSLPLRRTPGEDQIVLGITPLEDVRADSANPPTPWRMASDLTATQGIADMLAAATTSADPHAHGGARAANRTFLGSVAKGVARGAWETVVLVPSARARGRGHASAGSR